jgi:two-component system sensor histidine kinase ChvG
MRLAPRLLILSLVTMLLPWAGCQYLREMQQALRETQVTGIQATSEAVAGLLESRPGWFDVHMGRLQRPGKAPPIYAHPLAQVPVLDGYVEDWGILATDKVRLRPADSGSGSIDYLAGETPGFLWLFIGVEDDELVFGEPGKSDDIRIRLGSEASGIRDLMFAPRAPGPLSAQGLGWQPDARIAAYWQATSTGYNFEIRIPLTTAGERIGFLITDRDQDGTALEPEGTLADAAGEPGWLVRQHANINELLAQMLRPGLRLTVVDFRSWILGAAGDTRYNAGAGAGRLLARRLLRNKIDTAIPRGGSFSQWPDPPGSVSLLEPAILTFEDEASGDITLAAIRPLVLSGDRAFTLLAEQDAEALLSVADRAALRLFAYSIGAMLAVGILLVGFAIWLSMRIRRLSRAATRALGQSGELSTRLPDADSRDELGDLSRDFSRLLKKVRDYNLYLQSLGGKLTHELRTPMTIVGTSLENLADDPGGEQSETYLRRARDGIERLRVMVNALGAATRMEESIAAADKKRFDLRTLISDLGAAYQAAHPELDVHTEIDNGEFWTEGSADLIAQMVDKLFQNARDFCRPGGRIDLLLSRQNNHPIVCVRNTGSTLPDSDHERLFDSLVSRRDRDDTQSHLGLGLYIVRLVAEHHGGSASARNLPSGDGVEFRVSLPASG